MKVGICGYGVYIPRFRIRVEEIAAIWGGDAEGIKRGLQVREKAIAGLDEDTATIAVEASRSALAMAGINPAEIGAVYVGSESHPYAVKPTATILGDDIEASPVMTAADYEFACKAGTAAIQTCMGLVGSGMIRYGLAVGADTAQGAPGDTLEYTAASGGAAYIIGSTELIAEIEATYSVTTDTPDFWRREGEPYPRHGGRFTGSPAYFKHVLSATTGLLKKTNLSPGDFDYAVFHQPNGKFPRTAAKNLGFTKEQIECGLLVERIGNTYSGATMLGLARVLDEAKPGDRILVTAFGSGAGSDSFSITVTDKITEKRGETPTVEDYIREKKYVDYGTYVKLRRKIVVPS
ncbi:MAG: hydroxymethylglutaryl-CoA synthase [Candidatus Hydrothermarchaeales archaeon]